MKRQKNPNPIIIAVLILCLAVSSGGCQAARQLQDGIEDLLTNEDETPASSPASHENTAPDAPDAQIDRSDAWDDTVYDPLLYPYYGLLAEDAQAIYRQICYYAANGVASFEPCRSLTEAELETIMTAVYYDQPGLFWLDGNYEYRHLHGQIVELILHFNDLAQNLEANRQRFAEAARTILDMAREAREPAAQERIVHDQLLGSVTYDENAPYNQNAYSALVQGSAVCAGYARAFQYLMLQLQIPCYYCVGVAISYRDDPNGSVEDHAWNIICLDGEYYNVDPTWDDTLLSSRELISYSYFNLPDDRFLADHTRDEKSAKLPACNGQSHTYEALYGQPAELGILPALELSAEDVIYELEAYYERCTALLTETGRGESNLTVVLWGEDLIVAVQDAINTGAYEQGFLQPAVNDLSLNGYHFSVHIAFQELGHDCYLLEQSMTLD